MRLDGGRLTLACACHRLGRTETGCVCEMAGA
jgi:hypothetical protein